MAGRFYKTIVTDRNGEQSIWPNVPCEIARKVKGDMDRQIVVSLVALAGEVRRFDSDGEEPEVSVRKAVARD
jgi:hypothetical protein